jgi:hypothetical protein
MTYIKIATAAKTGRNKRFPYVPVIKTIDRPGFERTAIVRGYAFSTREEAVAFAQKRIVHVWGDK